MSTATLQPAASVSLAGPRQTQWIISKRQDLIWFIGSAVISYLALGSMTLGVVVALIQFIKGAMNSGEKVVFEAFPDLVEMRPMGEGFTWDTQDRERDIAKAREAWEAAKARILDPAWKMVVCDELNIVLRYDYLPLAEVIAVLAAKRRDLHVIVTGRNAKSELVELADLVTEMTEVKHPFRAGVKAQQGIEF